jgi:hypothetical protein
LEPFRLLAMIRNAEPNKYSSNKTFVY